LVCSLAWPDSFPVEYFDRKVCKPAADKYLTLLLVQHPIKGLLGEPRPTLVPSPVPSPSRVRVSFH
jgi:hypothetical protein